MSKLLNLVGSVFATLLFAANTWAAIPPDDDTTGFGRCALTFVPSAVQTPTPSRGDGSQVFGDPTVRRQPWESAQPGDADYIPNPAPTSSSSTNREGGFSSGPNDRWWDGSDPDHRGGYSNPPSEPAPESSSRRYPDDSHVDNVGNTIEELWE
jgi:hypothetical protein